MEPAFEKSFWGLVIEKGKQYKQTPKFNFHISMAVLDLTTADASPISVWVNVDNKDYLLCNLTKECSQSRLDQIFAEGEKVKFYTTGNGNVHLTGYAMPEENLEGFEDEDFSEDESVGSEVEKLNLLAANNKRKNTETLKLIGKDAKKLKVDAKEPVKAGQKVIDVDPKQLLQKKDVKAPDAQQKGKLQANQPQPKKDNKPQIDGKPAKKGLEDSDDDDDDDLSIDEDEESVDINNIQAMMDEDDSEVDDDDLESDDDDLSDEDEADVAKLKQIKGNLNKSNQAQQAKPTGKPQNAGGSPGFQKKPQQQQHNKPHQQQHNKPKQQGGQPNKFGNANKTPQQNKGQTPQNNKSQQKHQQTPFHKGQQNSNKKPHSPFQHQNKSFGSHNKKPFKKNPLLS